MFKKFTLKKGKTLLKGLKAGGLKTSSKSIAFHFKQALTQFLRQFYGEMKNLDFTKPPEEKNSAILKGLHKAISKRRFSIIIVESDGNDLWRGKALDSARLQTAPDLEILTVTREELFKVSPSGDYILQMNEDVCLRFDLLYRYEQLIRTGKDIKALHAGKVDLDARGCIKPGTLNAGVKKFQLPYEFSVSPSYGLLVAKEFWEPDITLEKLDLKGVFPTYVPLPLVGCFNGQMPLVSLDEKIGYFKAKGLDWEFSPGLLPNNLRALPPLEEEPEIQVIIPYKEHKELTLKAAASALQSRGVKVHVTAVDNGSQDKSIKEALEALGVSVLLVEEPFNYSRLNNLAAAKHSCRFIFFLNNDAEIEPDAFLEMARWASLPDIGMVGCRLHYPNGLIQHAGVHVLSKNPFGSVVWGHADEKMPFDECTWAKTLHAPDAVTAAAAMVERKKFDEVGGFDEVLYPIAFSDTDLCRRLLNKGYKSFYTPYAVGLHHESLSREAGFMEDFDHSSFLESFSELERLS